MEYLYSYCYDGYDGECGPDYWDAWPILKITPKRIVIGGRYGKPYHLDRQLVEAGKCRRPEWIYTEAHKAEKDPEGNLEVRIIKYEPEKFASAYHPKPTAEELEFAKALAEDWFRKHPEGKPVDCACEIALKHNLPWLHKYIAKLKLHQPSKPPEASASFYQRLGKFCEDVAAHIRDDYIVQYDDGPVWVRICEHRPDGGNSAYCFIRKADGAIFQAAGWKTARTKTGVIGYLHDYAPDLLHKYGLSTPNGKRYLRRQAVLK